jgi:succinate dehydrogenase hydrophobic anchor subunit
VVDDYIHEEAQRLTIVIAIKAAAALLALACIVAILKLALLPIA